jgi:hypothetical protein
MTHEQDESQKTPPQDPRSWLDHIPPPRRGPVANIFHGAVRQTRLCDPRLVVQAVRDACARRQRWGTDTDVAAILAALDTDPASALRYAQYIVDYESLPREARQRLKAERAIHYVKEAMRGQAATPAQLTYLRALGWRGDPPEDRAEASTLIDQLRRGGGQS